MADRVVIASACRTAVGKMGGALSTTPAAELGAIVIKEAVKRAGIKPEDVDQVFMGCVIQAAQGQNVATEFISSNISDVTVVVVDATCLERNLNLVYQIMNITNNVIICVNLLDEAKKKGIKKDLALMSHLLGVPVVGTTARCKKTLVNLMKTVYNVCTGSIICTPKKIDFPKNVSEEDIISTIMKHCERISKKVCHFTRNEYNSFDRKVDKVLTSKIWGIPIMLLFLAMEWNSCKYM